MFTPLYLILWYTPLLMLIFWRSFVKPLNCQSPLLISFYPPASWFLYSFCNAFSLKTLLFFYFTTYNFLIILFFKLGEIWEIAPLPKWRNGFVPGIPKQRGKEEDQRYSERRKNLQKINKREREVLFFCIDLLYVWLNSVTLTNMQRSRRGSWKKGKSPDIFLEIIMWNQHFLKTLFYSKGVYSTDVSSDILWVPVISVLDIWITILDNAKPS